MYCRYVEREVQRQWGVAGVETTFVLALLWPRVQGLRRQSYGVGSCVTRR